MNKITVFPGRYIQGKGALNDLGKEISRFGKNGFVICTPHAFNNVLPKVKSEIERSVGITAEKFGRECCDYDLMKVAEKTCTKGENIYNEPQEITPDLVFKAIKAADSEGRRRKG
jgi:glycerol dehydrogenase-like iron-containing ADH family enzyme